MRIVDKGNDIIIEGHLYSLVCDTIGTATIKVYEDNAYLTSVTTDEYGFFHIVIPTSAVGVRNFKLIYEGDSNYTGSESTTIEVTVRDAPVLDEIILVSDKLVCQLGERFHFTATCQSQYDDDLAQIQVQLRKDDVVIQTVTTGTDGKAYLKFTPSATGSYSITATSGNVSSDPILVVVSEGNIYEIIADLNEFPGTYSKEEIDALLLALKTLLEESKADVGHIHQIRDIPNLQQLLDDKVTWEAFYNSGGGGGGGGDVPIVANWTSNPSDTRVPSEKLTKNTLDTKSDVGHTHDDRYYTETEIDNALLIKQDLLVSGTNIKTINNQSLLGSGNITIQGGGSVDWSDIENKPSDYPPSSHNHDDRYYTESEVNTALNSKQNTLISGTNIKTINNISLLGSGNISVGGGGGSSNLFDLNTVSQYGDNAIEEGVDRDGTGLGYGSAFLIYNSQAQKFYYDKNGSADYDTGNELATMNDVPTNSSIVDLIYPVGSIYMSVNSVNPSTLFGGTWEQIEDKFLLASGTSYSNGATGGSADATLVSHNHTVSATGEYFVTSENSGANNTRVQYNSNGNRYVDGMTTSSTPFHHREYVSTEGSSATGMNMPPYLVVNVWKRTA